MLQRNPDLVTELDPAAEPTLLDYSVIVWRWRYVIAVIVVVGVLAALAVNWLATPIFEASATMLAAESKLNPNARIDPTSVLTIAPMLANTEAAAKVIGEFHLDRDPYRLTPLQMVRDVVDVQNVRGTNLIRLGIRLKDPQLAAALANRLADLGVDLSARVSAAEALTTRSSLQKQLEDARRHLDQTQQALLDTKQKYQLELLAADSKSVVQERGDFDGLLLRIAGERARLNEAQKTLASVDKTRTVRRAIENDPAAIEAARPAVNGALTGLRVDSEYANPTYEQLERIIATSRTTLASLEAQRDELQRTLHISADTSKRLSNLYTRQTEQSRLELEYELAKTVYTTVQREYENSNLSVLRGTTSLQVVDRAIAPERPVLPRKVFNLAVGLALGLIAALMIAFVAEYGTAARRLIRR